MSLSKNLNLSGVGEHKMRVLIIAFGICLIVAAHPADCTAEVGRKTIVACVGDSITEMQGNTKRTSYPGYLQWLLGERYTVVNFGKSGTCVLGNSDKPYSKSEAFLNFKKILPDIVVIALGTNDSRPNNWKHKANFAASYKFLIDSARALPSRPQVLVVLPIPMITNPGQFQYSLNGESIAQEIVPQIRKIAHENNCPIVDLFGSYTSTPDAYIDGVHPTDAGLEQIARLVADAIAALPQVYNK